VILQQILSRLDEVKNVWKKSKCKNININFTKHKFIKELTEDKWINKIETLFRMI
jgi:hypothetical protein